MQGPHLILAIGELLWDVLPEGPRLGGAPANFAVMAGRLGSHTMLLSRIGNDDFGRRAIDRLKNLPVDVSMVEVDAAHETGRVTVRFENGQPQYNIHQPAAWDAMELTGEWARLATRASAICFGTLAQRSQISRQTIQSLVAQTSEECFRVFDVNLRAPFYSAEVLRESLELANVVKMSDEELPTVLTLLGIAPRHAAHGDELRSGAERLLAAFPTLRIAAITRGGKGSLLVARDEWNAHPGIAITVADTIGAGDSFTAAMTHYLLRGASLATLNDAGNRWGSWVASQTGAMPELSDETRRGIQSAIENENN